MTSIIKLRLMGMRRNIVVIFLMFALTLGLLYVMSGAYDSEYKYTILIVDNASNDFSQKLTSLIYENKSFNFEEAQYKEAVNMVEEGNALAAIIIDENSARIAKVKDDMKIYALENYLSSTILKMSSNLKISEATTEYISRYKAIDDEKLKEELYKEAVDSWKYRKPVEVARNVMNTSNKNKYDNMKHMTIGFILFFSMYTIVFGIGSILEDKKYKMWEKILISPISKTSILGGNMVVAFLMGAFQIFSLIIISKYLFQINWGKSVGGIFLLAAAFIFSVTSLGLFLSGIVKNYSQLSAAAPIVLTSTSMLGGAMWPLEIVNSKILLFLANLTPQKWAIEGIEGIAMYGKGFSTAIAPTFILIAMGIIYFFIGVKLINFE